MRLIICIMLLVLSTHIAALKLESPHYLLRYDNLEFTGRGKICPDLTSLLAWRKTMDDIRYIQIMRFSEAGLPMWQEPLTLPCDIAYFIECSSDAFFVLMLSTSNLKAFKFSLSGTAIWPMAGIDLQPGNSLMPYELILHPDSSGGLWLVSNSHAYVFPTHYASIQRLDASGNPAFGTNDIVFGGDNDCYLRDSILLENNSIMISLSFRDANTLIQFADDGQELYRRNFATTQFALEYSSLEKLSPTKLIYAVGRRDFADVYVLSVNGEPTLQNSFTIACDEDAAQYVDLTALSSTEAILSVMNYATSELLMSKITETGDVIYQRTMTEYRPNDGIHSKLHPTDDGECYFVYNEGDCCIRVEKISFSGVTLWERDIISPENFSGKRPDFLSGKNSDGIKIFWMDYRFAASGIYYQAHNASGTPVFLQGGEPLVTGTRGFVLDANVHATGQSSMIVTLCRKDKQTKATLHLARWETQPGNSWPANGIVISDDVTRENRIAMKTLKTGEDILVLWVERDQTDHLKAQLISPEGHKKWGAEGITIFSGDIISFFGSIVGGSIFVAWQRTDGNAYCQKVLSGMLIWPSICLYDQNTDNPVSTLKEFSGGYAILSGNGGLRVLRILSDGSFHPAFGDQGLQVLADSDSYVSSRYLENHLIMNVRFSHSYPSQFFPIVISPDAGIHYNQQQCLSYTPFRSYLKSGNLYTARYDNGLEISKFNLAFECLWTRQLPVYVSMPDGYILGAIEALNDSCFVLLYYIQGTDYAMHYYIFDADGNSSMANPGLLYNCPVRLSRKYDIGEDGIYFLYWDFMNGQWLKQQKIDVESQAQPSEELSTSPQIVFRNPYPNPFNGSTTIQFFLKEPAYAKLSLYNLKGQRVKDIFAGEFASGLSSIKWDGNDAKGMPCAQGIYFVRLEAKGELFTAKLIKLR